MLSEAQNRVCVTCRTTEGFRRFFTLSPSNLSWISCVVWVFWLRYLCQSAPKTSSILLPFELFYLFTVIYILYYNILRLVFSEHRSESDKRTSSVKQSSSDRRQSSCPAVRITRYRWHADKSYPKHTINSTTSTVLTCRFFNSWYLIFSSSGYESIRVYGAYDLTQNILKEVQRFSDRFWRQTFRVRVLYVREALRHVCGGTIT